MDRRMRFEPRMVSSLLAALLMAACAKGHPGTHPAT